MSLQNGPIRLGNPIRLGIVGAGIFMRDVHLPAIVRLDKAYRVVAMASKSGESARKLAETFAGRLPGEVAIYTDPAVLLAREDIDVVDIVLPIDVMPAVVEQALASGKHVISEEPIAADTETGRHLIDCFRRSATQFPAQQWMVAENWRYEAAFLLAKELVATGEIGRPLTFQWAQHVAMNASNKYWHTPWRRAGHLAGGFLLDVSVHHMAALRLILGEVANVTADSDQFSPDLPPVDTLAATIRMQNGVLGSYLLTFAAAAAWQPLLQIVGDGGSLRIQRGFVEVTNHGQTRALACAGMNGVEVELAAFAASLQGGEAHRNEPEEALHDLLAVESMLKAAATGQRCRVEKM